jgi:hypothetical protein
MRAKFLSLRIAADQQPVKRLRRLVETIERDFAMVTAYAIGGSVLWWFDDFLSFPVEGATVGAHIIHAS